MDASVNQVDASDRYRENRGIGWQYRLKDLNGALLGGGLAYDTVSGNPNVDRTRMSATATISDATIDRVGDVLLPQGCVLDDYRRNPVCLWNHGLDHSVPFAIGKAEDENGNLAIQITETEVIGTTYFAKSNPIAVQIFQLIDEGVIKAVSVRETPLEQKQIFRNGQNVTLVPRWTLEEFSWTNVGVNPSAVRKTLSRNRLDGKPILEPIYKSLTATLPQKPATSHGGFVEQPAMASKLKSEDSEMDDDDTTKTAAETPADEKPNDGEKPAEASEDKPKENPDDVMKDDEPKVGDPNEDAKLGRQAIGYVDDGCKSLRGTIRSCCKSMEEPDVKAHLEALHDTLGEHSTALQGLRQEKYPMSSVLKDEDMGGGDESGGEDEGGGDSDSAMKSMLATFSIKRHGFGGCVEHVKDVLRTCKSLSADEKRKLNIAIDGFTKIKSQAKSLYEESLKRDTKTEKKPAITSAQQAEIDAAFALLKS
jgi:hypothetical protein